MMVALSFLLAAATLLPSAYCLPTSAGWLSTFLPWLGRGLTTEQLQAKMPTNGLSSNDNAKLQYVSLGVGIQNYSCSTGTPMATGAIATLFDITEYLQKYGNPQSSAISTKYLKAYELNRFCQASQNLNDNSCQERTNILRFDVLGKHFFARVDGKGVPYFDIYGQASLSAKKSGDVPAPADAYAGKKGCDAVDWLFLSSDGSSRTNGLSEVYRINTAGGNPDPTECKGKPADAVISQKYAAEYWFYL